MKSRIPARSNGMVETMKSAGIILLGGRALRLGGIDKASLDIGGRTCFARVHAVLSQGFDDIALSVSAQYSEVFPPNLVRIVDWPSSDGRSGAAFAVLACLNWAQEQKLDFVVTTPVDTPLLPRDYTLRLIQSYTASDTGRPVVAESGGRLHGLHALWPSAYFARLKSLILDENIYMIQRLHQTFESDICWFEIGAFDPFININTPDDLEAARRLAASLPR